MNKQTFEMLASEFKKMETGDKLPPEAMEALQSEVKRMTLEKLSLELGREAKRLDKAAGQMLETIDRLEKEIEAEKEWGRASSAALFFGSVCIFWLIIYSVIS